MAAARKLGSVQRSATEPPDTTELFKGLGLDKADAYAAKAAAQSSAAKGTLYWLLSGQVGDASNFPPTWDSFLLGGCS
jgi:hypothetical protein